MACLLACLIMAYLIFGSKHASLLTHFYFIAIFLFSHPGVVSLFQHSMKCGMLNSVYLKALIGH